MQTVVTARFGSQGSSWFFILGTTKNGRVEGLRWTPDYRKTTGNWNLTVLDLDDVRVERVPTSPRPLPPSQQVIDELLTARANVKAEHRAKVKMAQGFAKRLKAGEEITVTWIDSWHEYGKGRVTEECQGKLVGFKGICGLIWPDGIEPKYGPRRVFVDRLVG